MLILLIPAAMTLSVSRGKSRLLMMSRWTTVPTAVPPPSPCLMKHDGGALSLSLYYTLHLATQKLNDTHAVSGGALCSSAWPIMWFASVWAFVWILSGLVLGKQTRCLLAAWHFLCSSCCRTRPTPAALPKESLAMLTAKYLLDGL